MLYEVITIPVVEGDTITGVVRTAMAVTAIDRTLGAIRSKVLFGGLIAAVFAALLSLLVSRRISLPLEQMKQGAERFAKGELEERMAVRGAEEIRGLAEAMNKMAAQLDDP